MALYPLFCIPNLFGGFWQIDHVVSASAGQVLTGVCAVGCLDVDAGFVARDAVEDEVAGLVCGGLHALHIALIDGYSVCGGSFCIEHCAAGEAVRGLEGYVWDGQSVLGVGCGELGAACAESGGLYLDVVL